MHTAHPTAVEIVRRGEEIYEREIRTKVEADHQGNFLALDIDTGAYEIAEDDLTACNLLLAHHPNAEIFGLKIGSPAAYQLRRLS